MRFRSTPLPVSRLVPGVVLLAYACSGDRGPAVPIVDDGAVPEPPSGTFSCSIPTSQIFDGGVGKDGIPALTNPLLVPADDPGAGYLRPADRVVGVRLGDLVVAVPHNILWWHEIVNLDAPGVQVAVTYCPLTGSSLTFDRASVGGAELGVSGLLFNNNLMMYDRRENETLWPQMLRRGACGPATGRALDMFPSTEMTWSGWQELHPETLVISRETGIPRPYERYPYGDYEVADNAGTLFPMPAIDRRLPPKERVVGILKGGDGGDAYSFSSLSGAPFRAIPTRIQGRPAVLLWDTSARGGAVYFAELDGAEITIEVRDGTFVDRGTGSVWGLDGTARSGGLSGRTLEQHAETFVAFWFAWAHFNPETAIRRP